VTRPDEVRVALVTAPTSAAPDLARALVEGRVAACVNVVPGVRSVYRWNGAVEEADEAMLVIKVDAARAASLPERVAELHPHDVPEVLVFEVAEGLPAYLSWVIENTVGVS
jgi:periplasmic divalent cation tolerance protein